jgi:phenylacetate-CoA ligase
MDRRSAGLLLAGAYALLGEPVQKYLREFERTQWLSTTELNVLRVRLLRELLERASHRSPYYRRVLTDAGLRPQEVTSLDVLSRLPLLSKDEIRASWDDLVGPGPRGRRETRKTSGSTGLPLTIEKSRSTTGAMNGLMWRNYGWFEIYRGDRQARMWAGSPTSLASIRTRFSDRLQNRIRMSSFAMGPEQFDGFIEDLFSFRPKFIYGYGQCLYRLAEYADANDKGLEELGLNAVITTAEMTSDAQREVMARAFEAPVVNEYGCTETGIVAMDCPAGSMHVMDDGLVVEIVRDGVPVKPGEEGEILVTELYGSLMPLIRYRTGDRGVLSTTPCECGRPFLSLEQLRGRVTEFLRCPDGTLVDPYTIESVLKTRPEMYEAVRQWRVVQEGASLVRFTLCTAGAQARPDIESYLDERFSALTTGQLELIFEYEEWLQPQATGKIG